MAAPLAAGPADVSITVATTSDAVNGDVATVARLIANPGADGISLREAIEATNNDPGSDSYTIRFASTLAGQTIKVDSTPFRPLTGGGVTVEGDIEGDGKPDVTLRASGGARSPDVSGFQISSSGNRLHALALENFSVGVEIRPVNKPVPNHRTFADNVVTGLRIKGARTGIRLMFYSLECSPCSTNNVFGNTTITGNTIEASKSGIHFSLMNVVGDRVEGATVTDNTVRLGTRARPDPDGPGIQIDESGNSAESRISDVLIARNSIEGVQAGGDGGIFIAAGLQRAHANTIESIRILDNQVHFVRPSRSVPCCFAIVLDAGSDFGAVDPRITGHNHPDGNVLRNVRVAGNSVSGALAAGVRVQAGVDGGGSNNRIENVHVERNAIRSSILGKGIYLWVGQISGGKTAAIGNRIGGVTVDGNRIKTGNGTPTVDTDSRTAGGVVLLGGGNLGRGGLIRDVRVRHNRISTRHFGIRLIGGMGSTARGNRVNCVRLVGNRISGTRNRVSVRSNLGGAAGNRASLHGC